MAATYDPSPDVDRTSAHLAVIMFTDLADSSALARRLGDADYVRHVLEPHNAIFRQLLTEFTEAREIKQTGDGFIATFASPSDAAQCALRFHHALRTSSWQRVAPQTRIGIHLGEATGVRAASGIHEDVAGDAANMTARLMSLAEPGQSLLTKTAFDSARQSGRVTAPAAARRPDEPPAAKPELCWLNHGWYRFKGADEPFEVCEVGVVGESPLRPPADCEKARRVAGQKEAPLPLRERARRHFQEVFGRRRSHWLVVAALTAAGMALGHFFKTDENLFSAQYKVFEFLEEHSARPLRSSHAVVVLVDDDAYYKSEAAGRAPINRRYLAKIVRALGELNPAAIALDFDFRSPDPSGETQATSADGVQLPEFSEYVDETAELLETLRDTSSRRRIPVVLPATIGKEDGEFVKESDIYNGFDFDGAPLAIGYIALDTDTKVIPPTKRLKDGTQLDSFSLAIVRSVDDQALEGDQWSAPMYGGFIRGDGILQLAAGDVLHPESEEQLRKRVQHKSVLIGGAWHRFGYRRGMLIDSYDSPAGFIPGVLIHANYVEAVLDRRVVLPLSDWIVVPAEGLLAFSLAYALVLPTRPWIKASAVIGLIALPIVCSYVAVQNFGVYFDVLIVNILLLGHFLVEKLMEWYQHHRSWLAYARTSASGAEA